MTSTSPTTSPTAAPCPGETSTAGAAASGASGPTGASSASEPALGPADAVWDSAGALCCTPAPTAAPSLDVEEATALAARFKALADPNRLRVLSLLAADPRGEACVCDLTEPLGLGQPTVSHHVRILVEAGLVVREKRGVWTYCAVVPAELERVAEAVGRGIVAPARTSVSVQESAAAATS